MRQETRQEFDNVRNIVLKLLKNDEVCRNDDKWLTYRVMRHFTNIYIPFETIKRVRAKIQNSEGLYPPTDPRIIAKRRKRQSEVREWAKQ